MKQLLFLLLCLYSTSWLSGQSVSPQVISSAGGHLVGTDVQMSWTLGELSVETIESGSVILTQGFHQSNLMITAWEDLAKDISVDIYPNPTSDWINIELQASSDIQVKLLDAMGRSVVSKLALVEGANQLNLSGATPGLYFLQLIDQDQQTLKTFKIVKTK